jgi:hypothetical protein
MKEKLNYIANIVGFGSFTGMIMYFCFLFAIGMLEYAIYKGLNGIKK